MDKNIEENIELIKNLGVFVENINEVNEATALELYELNKILTTVVNENIKDYGTESRVILCRQHEAILNRLVSFDLNYKNDKIRNIYTPAVESFRTWKSIEFLKDKGLVGYFLGKELGAKPIMAFCKKNDYGNIKELLPEQELYFSNEGEELIDQYLNLLKNEYKSMDALILHGMYSETATFLDVYRKLRPDGKVYCGFDMNTHWLSMIDFTKPEIKDFMRKCDVVATSSSYVRDLMNNIIDIEKPCYYLPNGFSNVLNLNINVDVNIKENVILTVGRIGTPQKNNMELLVAFAKVADLMPDWTLRLVGSIEESFKPLIEKYFEKLPHLSDRVIFTGPINDKQMLFDEYARAKCFSLTSLVEGAPNVYAEALVHGCMFVFSDFDAAEEMTNYGELGYTYKLNDIDALCECLIKMAQKSTKKDFEVHISKALAYADENYNWEKNAKKLAFMLNN